MKSITIALAVASIGVLAAIGHNVINPKVKTLNTDMAINECKNTTFLTGINDISPFERNDMRDAVMYVAHIECTKSVNNFTRGIVIEKNKVNYLPSKVDDSMIEMVYNQLPNIKEVAAVVGEKLAYSRVVLK